MASAPVDPAAPLPGQGGTETLPVVTVNKSAVNGLLLSTATGALRIVGALAVGHGLATQGMVDNAIPAVSQEIVGALLAAAGQLWAWWREQKHSAKVAEVAEALPEQVVFK